MINNQQQFDARKTDINEAFRATWSEYSASLRHRLATITDYQKDFERAFEGFIENQLPRDELYRQIEHGNDKKQKHVEEAAKELLEGQNMLPAPEMAPWEKQGQRYHALRIEIHKKEEAEEEQRLIERAEKAGKTYHRPEEDKSVPLFIQQYEEQVKVIGAVDFDKIQKTLAAKQMALKKSEMGAYQSLNDGKMSKEEIEKYLREDFVREQERMKKVERDQMEKDYPSQLKNPAYGEFWEEIPRTTKPSSRQSQSVKRPSQQSVRTGADKKTFEKQRYSALPQITKNTVITRRDVDFSILEEDPIFGDFRRKNIRKRLMVPNGDIGFSAVNPMSPGLKNAQSAIVRQMPALSGGPQVDNLLSETGLIRIEEPEGKQPAQAAPATKDDVDAANKFFDNNKPQVVTKVDDAALKSKQREVDKLKATLEALKKTQKIDLQHAKAKAKQTSEELVKQKMHDCRTVYEEEFEHLAKQFEEINNEIQVLRAESVQNRKIIREQELVIAQIMNTVEAVGAEYIRHDQERDITRLIEGEAQEEHLKFVVNLNNDPNAYPTELTNHIKTADAMLQAQFNFYNFSVRLNIEEQIDIANRSYIRFYKKKINELLEDCEAMKSELETANSMVDDFKFGFERAERKIKQLEIQDAMFQEEKKSILKANHNRTMALSGHFVETFKDLHTRFGKYKEYCVFEFENHEQIRAELESIIKKKDIQIDELKDALSVPRQHYKHIDNRLAEEIVQQKEEIINKMSLNMGVPVEKLLETLYEKEASKKASQQVNQVFKAPKEGETETKAETKAEKESKANSKSKTVSKSPSMVVGADSPKLQRELSVGTILSKNTSSTLEGSVIAPPFGFGTHKIYTALGGLEDSILKKNKLGRVQSKTGAVFLFGSKSVADVNQSDVQK